MRIKTFLAALALIAAPSFALADACMWGHASDVTMSCAQGTVWDADTQTCVPTVSS